MNDIFTNERVSAGHPRPLENIVPATHNNVFQSLARLRKAIKLADAYDAIGYDDLTLRHISSGQSLVACTLANAHHASSDTWEVVTELLKQRRLMRQAVK